MILLLCCGDRRWTSWQTIYERLLPLFGTEVEVMHGNAQGADLWADGVARWLGFPVRVFPANWRKYGRAAGPIRNREMLKQKPYLVLAFHDHLLESKGTKDCVTEAIRRGIPVEVVKSTCISRADTL